MFPGVIAATTPDKPAIIDAARGLSLTYRAVSYTHLTLPTIYSV